MVKIRCLRQITSYGSTKKPVTFSGISAWEKGLAIWTDTYSRILIYYFCQKKQVGSSNNLAEYVFLFFKKEKG